MFALAPHVAPQQFAAQTIKQRSQQFCVGQCPSVDAPDMAEKWLAGAASVRPAKPPDAARAIAASIITINRNPATREFAIANA
jgi:hypothetical protein